MKGAILSRIPLPIYPIIGNLNQTFDVRSVAGLWRLVVDGTPFGEVQLGPTVAKTLFHSNQRRLIKCKFQVEQLHLQFVASCLFRIGEESAGRRWLSSCMEAPWDLMNTP